jgi:hypothetical protein
LKGRTCRLISVAGGRVREGRGGGRRGGRRGKGKRKGKGKLVKIITHRVSLILLEEVLGGGGRGRVEEV